ncbi:MAG: hypothetical protein GYA50_04885 [Eubacteriaceae bacterium]|nr:hypothetical protein [Eubacteriaceae bacterium]
MNKKDDRYYTKKQQDYNRSSNSGLKSKIRLKKVKGRAAASSPKPPKLTKEQRLAYHAKIREEFVPISKQKYKRLSKQQQKIYKYQERVAIPKKRILFYIQRAALGFCAFCVATGVVLCLLSIFWIITAPPVDLSKLEYIESSVILDNQGNQYQVFQGTEKREVVSIDNIPEIVQDAFVSIEDERYYTHQGIDLKGIIKAGLNVIKTQSLSGSGGSTITQQLIKGTHLSDVKKLKRKVMEWKLSIQLEGMLTKEKILEAYLNKVNFAWAWGIESASWTFFDKSCEDLSIAQAAVLASVPNAPTYYMPFVLEKNVDDGLYYITSKTDEAGNKIYPLNPNNANRAKLIIKKMLDLGYISQDEYSIAYAQLDSLNVGLKPQSNSRSTYSYFTDALYNQLLSDMVNKHGYTKEEAQEALLNGGLVIQSTIDKDIQTILETNAKNNKLFPAQSASAKAASAAKTKSTGETVNYIPQCAMVVLDNSTGYVVGLIGGRGEKTASLSLNRALRKFQIGSSTKPLTVYAPGIDAQVITLATTFDNVRIRVGGWAPRNSGSYVGMQTVRQGIAKSVNMIAVQAFQVVGIETSSSYALKLGLELDPNDYGGAALALGGYTKGQTPLRMAAAFATFPNQGVRTDPIMYTAVYDKEGNLLFENTAEKTQVFSAETAFLVTDAMKGVVRGGTTNISVSGMPVSGKTGTTDDLRHAWFCGFTPYYTGAVWYGYDENKVTVDGKTYTLNIGIYGGNKPGPASMWETDMRQIHAKKGLTSGSFPSRPEGIVTASVDSVSGKRPTELTAQDPRGSTVISEMFIAGTVPSASDDFHQELRICTASGKLATEFCPESTVVTKVMIVKPESRFPAGVTPLDPDYIPAAEKGALFIMTGTAADYCTVHSATSIKSIDLYNGASTPDFFNMHTGNNQTLTVKGTNASMETVDISTGLSCTSSDPTIASASLSGGTLTIHALAVGNCTITVTYTETSVTYTTTITVNVSGP